MLMMGIALLARLRGVRALRCLLSLVVLYPANRFLEIQVLSTQVVHLYRTLSLRIQLFQVMQFQGMPRQA
jgi:hypothetical protein